jgi:hypothetical protein
MDKIRRLYLVRPRRADTAIGERADHVRLGPGRPRATATLPRRQLGDMTQRVLSLFAAGDRGGEQFAAERHHMSNLPDVRQMPNTSTDGDPAARDFGFTLELFTSW